MSSIVVVSQDKRINGSGIALGVFNISHAMELFTDGALNNDVLLVLVIFARRFEVKLIVVGVGDNYLGLLHVDADGEDALEREVRILDISPIHFLVLVQQVGILKLLDWLLRNL